MALLQKTDTQPPKSYNKKAAKKELAEIIEKLKIFQRIMNAQDKYSILLVLQGMDASGKDGVVRRVFSGLNPSAIKIYSFKKPTAKERDHDFLWRVHSKTPGKGEIAVFNRSHYEDILVPSVEGYLDKKTIERRYDNINNFESLLDDHHTKVIKCYLHMDRDVQLENLKERLENPVKHWKHNDGDRDSRAKWDKYMDVYEEVFEKTDTKNAPRHIIPADENRYKALTIAKILLETFESMDLKWPGLDSELNIDELLEKDEDDEE